MKQNGLVLKSNGGLYEVESEGKMLSCRARGVFRYEKLRVLVGDMVCIESEADGRQGTVISEVFPRRSLLGRPPMANLDVLFVVVAAAKPTPILPVIDRLLCVVEDSGVKPILIITKADLAPENAGQLASAYRQCGYDVLLTSSLRDQPEALLAHKAFLKEKIGDGIAAFAGASGVGKSSLLRALFPKLTLEVGELSKKIDRGRQTTRIVQLFPLQSLDELFEEGYLADTPGFSSLDYINESRLTKENLALAFREFVPYLGECRYTDCTHLKEEGCAVLAAVQEGKIPNSRHESYLEMYAELKNKYDWEQTPAAGALKNK